MAAKGTDALLTAYEDEIDNLKFENSQLHDYTDFVENKIKNLQLFLHQGITFHKMVVEQDPSESNLKHLAFLQDALSLTTDTDLKDSNTGTNREAKPRLKSIYDLK
jgi:hypothetical protein